MVIELFPIPQGMNISQIDWAAMSPVMQSEMCRMVREMRGGHSRDERSQIRSVVFQEVVHLV